MIAFLQGQLVHLGKESVTLSVHGVGYELFLPTPLLTDLSLEQHLTFWVHTVVREDSITLFGFLTEAQKHLFVCLLRVDRIGPKMALRILSSGISVDQIITMIKARDVKGLSALPKVGQKMAEQIVFQLKGKLNITDGHQNKRCTQQQTIGMALLNLGFKAVDVEKALLQVPPESNLEQGVKSALAFLSGLGTGK